MLFSWMWKALLSARVGPVCLMCAVYFASRLYRGVPLGCLQWHNRRALLREEMAHWLPDVVAMQEVQLYADVAADMKALGECKSLKWRASALRRLSCLPAPPPSALS